MHGLYIEYRDPLFGIILFLALVLLITLATYGWSLYNERRRQQAIDAFLQEFGNISDAAIDEALSAGVQTIPAMLLLAEAFVKNGEYPRAIALYHALLARYGRDLSRLEHARVLGQLGRAYAKAGLLLRARNHLEESLRHDHANLESLRLLAAVADKSGQLAEALQIIDVLNAHGIDTTRWETFTRARLLMRDPSKGIERLEELAELLRVEPALARLFYTEALFCNPTHYAFEALERYPLQTADLLWQLEQPQIDFAALTNPHGRALATARGWADLTEESSVFELDLLIKLRRCGHGEMAQLNFEYLCTACKHTLPIDAPTCPHCMTPGSLEPVMQLEVPMRERLYE